VPAERARLGLMDSIHTRIQSRETVSVALSTFMLDLNQVILLLFHINNYPVGKDTFNYNGSTGQGASVECIDT
jgi:DNA mismatch repair protein MSH5